MNENQTQTCPVHPYGRHFGAPAGILWGESYRWGPFPVCRTGYRATFVWGGPGYCPGASFRCN